MFPRRKLHRDHVRRVRRLGGADGHRARPCGWSTRLDLRLASAGLSPISTPFCGQMGRAQARPCGGNGSQAGSCSGILLAPRCERICGRSVWVRAMYWIRGGGDVHTWLSRSAMPCLTIARSPVCAIGSCSVRLHICADPPVSGRRPLIGWNAVWRIKLVLGHSGFLPGDPPYHYGPARRRHLRIIGAVGVLFAPWAGRDGSQSPAFTVALAILTAIASYFVLYAVGYRPRLWGWWRA